MEYEIDDDPQGGIDTLEARPDGGLEDDPMMLGHRRVFADQDLVVGDRQQMQG